MSGPCYTVRRAARPPAQDLADEAGWERAEVARLGHFHARSSDHHPPTSVRLLWDERALYGRFEVDDRFVRAQWTQPQQMVCQDSCVEFFLRPGGAGGYFNFEFSCTGVIQAFFIRDWRRVDKAFADFHVLTPGELEQVRISAELTGPIDPERVGACRWRLGFSVDWRLIGQFVPGFGPLAGESTGNFYKCGDATSHPHWGMWSDVGAVLNYHVPERFGTLLFEP